MISQGKDFKAALKSVDEYVANLKKTLTPLLAEVQETAKIARDFHVRLAPVLRALELPLKGFAEAARVFGDKDFLEKFGYNWLVFLPAGTLLRYYTLYRSGKARQLQVQLKAAVRRESRMLLREYANSPSFRKRLAIIGPAFDAHLNGKYSLSIPALLSQVEGVIWDIAGKLQFPRRSIMITPRGPRPLLSLTFLIDNTPVGQSFFPTVTRFLRTKVFTETFRHGILHGEILNFATEDNSADLILLTRVLYEYCESLGV